MQSSAAGGFVFGGIFLQKRDGKRSPENGGGDNGFKTAAVLQGDCGLLRSICYHKACGLRVGCAAYGASLRISFTDEGDEINAGAKAAGKGSAAVYVLLVRGRTGGFYHSKVCARPATLFWAMIYCRTAAWFMDVHPFSVNGCRTSESNSIKAVSWVSLFLQLQVSIIRRNWRRYRKRILPWHWLALRETVILARTVLAGEILLYGFHISSI